MLPELPDRNEMGRYVALGQIGMEMVAPIVAGLVADHYLGWTPWGMIAGAVLGLVGGFVHLVHLLNKMDTKGPSQSNQESR
jgi:F0F1-type ATP synthase assembly protein I